MNEVFECGNQEALVSYLYDECDAGERQRIEAHLATCDMCAGDIAGLRDTRRELAGWMPPEAVLGFQLTPTVAPLRSVAGGRRPGWRSRLAQPLPAWAQIAAAALIFASGLAIGSSRDAAEPARSGVVPAATVVSTPARTDAAREPVTQVSTAVTREDLARVEARLREMDARFRTVATPVRADGSALTVAQVDAMLAASEDRLQRQFALQSADIVGRLNAARVNDMRQVGQQMRMVGGQVQMQQGAIDYMVERVSTSR